MRFPLVTASYRLTFIGDRYFSAAAGVNAVLGKNKPEASGLLQLQFRW